MTSTKAEDVQVAASDPNPSFNEAVDARVKAYLDDNLEDLVKAAMPETPEQAAQREKDSAEERIRKNQAAAKRKAAREAKARDKAQAEAAAKQAQLDAEAKQAFEDAVPFVGKSSDVTEKTLRGIFVDNGEAYSADIVLPVRRGELIEVSDGGLALDKEIRLPARGREFSVKGISLITDGGALRIEINGARKCGAGKEVLFPARSLIFRPHPAPVEAR